MSNRTYSKVQQPWWGRRTSKLVNKSLEKFQSGYKTKQNNRKTETNCFRFVRYSAVIKYMYLRNYWRCEENDLEGLWSEVTTENKTNFKGKKVKLTYGKHIKLSKNRDQVKIYCDIL